jgi:predicted dehydrogenase
MQERLQLAVVGCGHWGSNYVRLLSGLPDVELVSICDASEARLREAAAHYPHLKLVTDVDEMIETCAVDAAVICTEACSHYSVARKFIERGKHVLVEKPLTTDSAEAEDLIAQAASRGIVLMVGHIFMFNAGIERVKSEIVSGNAGDLHYLYSQRTNLGPIRHDVNVLWDLASHDVAIFNYLLNSPPEWVSAVGASFLQTNIEDVGFVVLGYRGGILGHIHVSWADPHKVREMVAVGSEQRIVFDDISPQFKVMVYHKGIAASSVQGLGYGSYQFALRDGDIVSPSLAYQEPLKRQVLHFIECVEQGKRPLTDGLDGLQVVKTIEAANRSMRKNGVPVPVFGPTPGAADGETGL